MTFYDLFISTTVESSLPARFPEVKTPKITTAANTVTPRINQR